jgi:predicted chitinase
LEGNPKLALLPSIAADILALYFRERGVAAAAIAGRWKRTRVLVNGGLNGWKAYADVLSKLGIVL